MAESERLNVVGLLSGGKDSCYNLCHCVKLGHRVVALATLAPPEGKDELDSYMYQTVGHDAVHLIAEAMEVPLYRTTIRGTALNQTATYGDRLPVEERASAEVNDVHDETEDMHELLLQVKRAHPEVNAVSVGAILSNYQRVRVEHVAMRPDIQMLPLSFLWQRNQAELLDEMCAAGMNSILIKVAGAGLDERDLGKSLAQMRSKLHRLNTTYGAHICGEGGEYETLTLDCPLFKKRIVLDRTTTVMHGESSSDGVYYLNVNEAHLEGKEGGGGRDELACVILPPVFDRFGYAIAKSNLLPAERLESRKIGQPLAIIEEWSDQESFIAFNIEDATSDDVSANARRAFMRLESALTSKQLSFAHLAHLNVYLSSQQHFTALNDVYRTVFGVDPPSRACIAVPGSNGRIALDAIAQTSLMRRRKALHVQGRSHWAAANIGPYSQAVECEGHIGISGQIGLAPPTLALVPRPEDQIVLALQHARRILAALLEDHRVSRRQGWVESCICWLNDRRWLPFARQVWSMQCTADEEEAEEEDRTADCWDGRWLGEGVTSPDVPTLFIELEREALPRGACAEWQLTAQSGDENGNDETVPSPRWSWGSIILDGMSCNWHVSSIEGTPSTSFGIAAFSRVTDSPVDDQVDATPFHNLVSSAILIRVMHSPQVDVASMKHLLRNIDERVAVTWIPVVACFDVKMNMVDAAIVWQSRR